MRPSDQALAQTIQHGLVTFSQNIQPLPGISSAPSMNCLINQMIDSVRRIRYITTIRNKQWSAIYTDASNVFFDPLKAAVYHHQMGNIDEAFWLVFLATHFGKNKKTGWGLVRGMYGAMTQPVYWDWITTRSSPLGFQTWLQQNQTILKSWGNFSNHRKYQSLDAVSTNGTGAAVLTYISWVGSNHLSLITNIRDQNNYTSRQLFGAMYDSMNAVASFGRTARFDYLTMIGKLGFAPIEPASTYMKGATGPKSGACLLFGGSTNSNLSEAQLSLLLNSLDSHLNLYFGMQVLEDALCNWQKSPYQYMYFNG